jgi:gentisate 1,2-dioxygenase
MSATTLTPEQLAATDSLDALYPKLTEMGVCPGWNKPTPSLWPAPKKSFQPVHWSYSQAKGALDAAGRLIRTELAERRNLILYNPIEGNTYATTRTIVAAYQMIMPGERAPSHRHVPNALRLIVDAGEGAYTIVNGKRYAMLSGDVVLTPNWCWHGHGNEGTAPAYWIDFLDVPLVQILEPMFFERHPDHFEPEGDDALDVPESVAEKGMGGATSAAEGTWAYPRQQTEERLSHAPVDPSGRFGTQIELGHPAMDTISLWMMRLAPKTKTTPYRTTANNIYAVVSGHGVTVIDGRRTEWERGDVIAVPTWYEHHHEASEDAVLFRVTDEPTMAKLGYLRE